MNEIFIESMTVAEKKHGLHIYADHLEKLIHQYFKKTHFVRSYFESPQRVKKVTNLTHLQYDTESFFYVQKGLHLLFKHWQLFLSIKSRSVPAVITLHGLFDDQRVSPLISKTGEFFFVFLLLFFHNTFFITHSPEHLNKLQKKFISHKDHFFYVPHLIYLELVEPISPQRKSHRVKNLTTLGFIGPWKGQLELIHLLYLLSQQRTDFKYLIAGLSVNKTYYDSCKRLVKKYHLQKQVEIINKFITPQEFKKYLSETDIYLDYHTRQAHSGSGTLTHALAGGKTILAYQQKLLLNPENKHMFTASTDAEYIEKLNQLLDSNKNLIVNTKANLKLNKKIAQMHMDIYKKALA
jgi:glycosyltransferase involved in cell wall biosynthesis